MDRTSFLSTIDSHLGIEGSDTGTHQLGPIPRVCGRRPRPAAGTRVPRPLDEVAPSCGDFTRRPLASGMGVAPWTSGLVRPSPRGADQALLRAGGQRPLRRGAPWIPPGSKSSPRSAGASSSPCPSRLGSLLGRPGTGCRTQCSRTSNPLCAPYSPIRTRPTDGPAAAWRAPSPPHRSSPPPPPPWPALCRSRTGRRPRRRHGHGRRTTNSPNGAARGRSGSIKPAEQPRDDGDR
jgi:hypothetical protein